MCFSKPSKPWFFCHCVWHRSSRIGESSQEWPSVNQRHDHQRMGKTPLVVGRSHFPDILRTMTIISLYHSWIRGQCWQAAKIRPPYSMLYLSGHHSNIFWCSAHKFRVHFLHPSRSITAWIIVGSYPMFFVAPEYVIHDPGTWKYVWTIIYIYIFIICIIEPCIYSDYCWFIPMFVAL